MALRKVRGSRTYKADDSGLKDFGQSPQAQAAALDVAQRLAGNAEAIGRGTYEAAPATVTVGWSNELRAGAVVREKESVYKDSRDSILLRVADAMRVRSGE